MADKLIYILPIVTLLLFVFNLYWNGNSVQSSLLFVLFLLPLMNLKVTKEAYGGFTTFDAICFYTIVFQVKNFTKIQLERKNASYLLLFILLGSIVLLGGLASEFPENTYYRLFKVFPIFIFGRFFILECTKDLYFHARAINALKIGFITSLTFLFIQVILGLNFTFYPDLHQNTFDPVYKIIRYPGVFYDSQASGQYLAMGCFIILYNDEITRKRNVIWSYIIFILAIVGIFLAGSRSAFGGFAVGLFVVMVLGGRIYRIYGSILLVIAVLLFPLVLSDAGSFKRNENLTEDYLFRESIWKEAYEISKDHPYLGIGSGNYKQYIMKHVPDQYIEVEGGEFEYFDQPENGYLKILVEFGFIGFGAFCLFLLLPLYRGLCMYVQNIIDKKITFLIASLLCWMVAFNTVYSIADTRLLILVASILVLIITYPSKKRKFRTLLNNRSLNLEINPINK